MTKKPRILLVDDELSMVKIVGSRLKVEGFDVEIAMDGQEALIRARAERPDLIILDLRLPKVDGYDVCRILKRDADYQRIPIVMFTAKAQPHEERLGMECGADAYIRKPFRAEELVETIRSLLLSSHSAGDGQP